MEETRKQCIDAFREHMEEIATIYKTAYPNASYLSMTFFVKSGTMDVNNEYFGADSDFPISERFDGKWYDYRKRMNQ